MQSRNRGCGVRVRPLQWSLIRLLLIGLLLTGTGVSEATPLYGPSPSNAAGGQPVPGGGVTPPPVPDQSVPTINGPGFNPPNSGGIPQSGPTPSFSPTGGGQGFGGSGGMTGSTGSSPATQTPTSSAPTFMNGSLPNTTNPFLPSNISPGLLSGPLVNAYMLNGVPQMAAPLMSVVYRPFGLTYFQPNPFQVTPQGTVSLTGTFETDTNIDFSPNQPQVGSLYSITPAVLYSTFDDYGFLSLLASASYYAYDTGNIPAYLDEMGGITAGTYLGNRVFVGAQDLGLNGSTPQMNGQPLAFFNGINAYYENMADAEVGIALTPKITFVQSASDMYFGDEGFGAGFMNLQSLMDSLNYMDKSNYISGSYIYQQGIFSEFPGFYSNGATGTAMRQVGQTTSMGVGGNVTYYFYQNDPTLNMIMDSYYGIFTRTLFPGLVFSAMGGWNSVVMETGQNFQMPLVDLSLQYTGARLSLAINAGEFMENMQSYGVELGPEKVKTVMGVIGYKLGSKTYFSSSAGYTYYDILTPYGYSNNFFQTLQPNLSYNGSYLELTDDLSYQPYSWLTTSFIYNMINFTTNIPNETVIDNQFIAMLTFNWNFK